MTRAERFFSNEEKKKIAAAVQDAESRTAGEIAIVVVDRSDEYREAATLGSMLLGAGIALVAAEAFFDASLHHFILIALAASLVLRLLFRAAPRLSTAFIGRRRIEEAVRERAVRAFYEKGLYKTRENTGVLFFLSLLERKVWVLADKGIYEKIDQSSLQCYAAMVSKGIKDGNGAEALCSAIAEVGGILAQNFPPRADDVDELPNEPLSD